MTLKEAKKRIKQAAEESRRDYNTYMDDHVKGEEYGLRHALSILESVDTEPVGNSDKITLQKLADVLKKIFPQTRYVTVGDNPKASIVGDKIVSIFYERNERFPKPEYNRDSKCPNTWGVKHPVLKVYEKPFYVTGIHQFYVQEIPNLDLSEYKNENGEIDYSRCIVEV